MRSQPHRRSALQPLHRQRCRKAGHRGRIIGFSGIQLVHASPRQPATQGLVQRRYAKRGAEPWPGALGSNGRGESHVFTLCSYSGPIKRNLQFAAWLSRQGGVRRGCFRRAWCPQVAAWWSRVTIGRPAVATGWRPVTADWLRASGLRRFPSFFRPPAAARSYFRLHGRRAARGRGARSSRCDRCWHPARHRLPE